MGTAQKWVKPGFGGPESLRLVDVRVPAPRAGEVRVTVRAVGVNPIDAINLDSGPVADLGYEVSGTVSAVAPGTRIASGQVAVGDQVLAFRVRGGYATELGVRASDVFEKPSGLGFAEAANLLLVGSTAAEMIHFTRVRGGETILIHGASGAVGISAVQQARLRGARVVGTARPENFDVLVRFGAQPVAYGPGLESRVRELAPEGISAALDAVGTDEAVDVSLALVGDLGRIASSAAFGRARRDGFRVVGGEADSDAFRDSVRARLIDLAGRGDLVVPIARSFPFADAPAALRLIATGHAGGKLALITSPRRGVA